MTTRLFERLIRQQPALYLILCFALLCAFSSSCKKSGPARSTASEPTPEPLEDRILFVSGGCLYSTNLAGESVSKLSEAGKNIWFPSASPDFQQIAFWSTGSGFNELWIYNTQAKNTQQITFFNERLSQTGLPNFNVHNAPAWAPDGKSLFFSHLGKIWKIDAGGFNLETITPVGTHYSPAVSPDGKYLVYITEINQNRILFLRQLNGNDEWPLTKFPMAYAVGSPAWSPDGRQIAFSVAANDKVDIWLINADGSNLLQLTKDGFSNSPSWSLDSTKLAFSSGRQDPYHWEIWVMNRDGSSQFCITRNGGYSPVWVRQTRQAGVAATIPEWIPTPAPQPTSAAIPLPAAKPTAAPVLAKPRLTAVPTVSPASAAVKPIPQPSPLAAKIKPVAPHPTQAVSLASAIIKKAAAKPTAQLTKTEAQKNEEEYDQLGSASKVKTAQEKENEYAEYEEYADKDRKVLPEETLGSKKDKNKIVFTPVIDFYFAKDLIKPESMPTLTELAAKLNEYPDATLVVQGYMRGPGLLQKFLPILRTLSRARANSVLRHLIVNEKIRQINVNALGEGDPFPDMNESESKLILLVEVR